MLKGFIFHLNYSKSIKSEYYKQANGNDVKQIDDEFIKNRKTN